MLLVLKSVGVREHAVWDAAGMFSVGGRKISIAPLCIQDEQLKTALPENLINLDLHEFAIGCFRIGCLFGRQLMNWLYVQDLIYNTTNISRKLEDGL